MNLPESFYELGAARWLGIPLPVLLFAVVVLLDAVRSRVLARVNRRGIFVEAEGQSRGIFHHGGRRARRGRS